jgi:hypothetical protein
MPSASLRFATGIDPWNLIRIIPAEGVCKHDANSHLPAGGWLFC